MNGDLENELKESPELAAVVGRLRASLEIGRRRETGGVRRFLSARGFRLAASLLAAVAMGVWLLSPRDSRSAVYGAREYRLTPAEMIASQNADGSWQNDFLTRRNAAALRTCKAPGAQIAYKKAMRNLRARGVL